jgi:hypothetical protein
VPALNTNQTQVLQDMMSYITGIITVSTIAVTVTVKATNMCVALGSIMMVHVWVMMLSANDDNNNNNKNNNNNNNNNSTRL